MSIYQKFTASFVLALALHFAILAMFGVSFNSESKKEAIKQTPLPEIIQASILDDEKIQQEAERLKDNETNRKAVQQEKKKTLEDSLKKEQARLESIKKERVEEEEKTKELEEKRKELVEKEKQEREEINKRKVEEAARLAKIKEEKKVEELRVEKLRKEKEKKREAERVAEKKKKQALLAKQKAQAEKKKAEKARQAALLKQQAAAASAKIAQDKRATHTAQAAIKQRVMNGWIKPVSSTKGLSCIIKVKLLPSGDVMDVIVTRSSGDSIFDRSAENAVRKASPLPVPKSRELFSQHFRTFNFNFNPK